MARVRATTGLSWLLVLYSAPRGFSPVFPSPQKSKFPNSNSIECRTSLKTTFNNYNPRAIGLNASQFLKPMDNKHNSLNLAATICSDICPWILSVPRSSQFSSSFALGTVCRQISEHIFAPNEGYCLFIIIYLNCLLTFMLPCTNNNY